MNPVHGPPAAIDPANDIANDTANFCGVSRRMRWALFTAVALLALAIRLPQLGVRPMHTDESVNAYITGEILDGQGFRYDPQDRHGPILFALAEPLVRILGAHRFAELTETQLRLTPVILGSLTVLLFGAGVEMFGFIPCLVAALLFALAPVPVYYNRYFIHETLFVAITLGLILSGWRAWVHRTVGAAIFCGLCGGLLIACKETCVLHFFALAAAVVCGCFLPPKQKLPPLKIVAIALAVLAFVAVLLFTWFGRNWSVFTSLMEAVPRFTARAGGEGHEKAFGYYFTLLDPMMIFFILAAAGAFSAACDAVNHERKPQVLMMIYGVLIFLIYSAIPYKTPWLALNLWLPLALACGFGVAAIWEQIKNPSGHWFVAIAGGFLLVILGGQTKYLAFDHPADEKNPLAYAHTIDDLLGLPPRLEEAAHQLGRPQPRIAVVAADPWPLPWYLRKFANVGYWQPGQNVGPADFYITTTATAGELTDRLKDFRPEFFGVRPEVLIILWVPAPHPTPQ
jgi:uncharacterized protein (TIGR03663 family)